MDATKLLKEDHDKVRELFKEYEAADARAFEAKKRLCEKMTRELEIHSEIEERIFYPAVASIRVKEAKELVHEAIDEHQGIKRLLQDLSGMEPQDETFDDRMEALRDEVEHHAHEEETRMFADARKGMAKRRLDELGDELERLKESLKSQAVSRT
jgi:iron-sulfur cluster repair protein YtfE (RIC family)